MTVLIMMMRKKTSFLFPAVLLLVVVTFQINTLLQPVDVPVLAQAPVLVSIPAGSSSTRVAGILEESGLIRNAAVFRYYARIRKMDQNIQAGNYLFSYGMTLQEILDILVRGDVYRPTIRVTIPEGFTLEQIAARLEESGLAGYEEFMETAGAVVPVLGRSMPGTRHALEGYLFPDTYEFEVNASPEFIISRMQGRMAEILTPKLRERAEELGMSIHEVLTLASLVEREVLAPRERDIVAGVLHNRLAVNMPLQLCASVLYALNEHKTEVTIEDTKVDSPYNTYKYPGLPPGPIAAPGESAILAVLYPADVDYLYFVTKGDGSGTHFFGRTLAEHHANIRKFQRNRENAPQD